MDHRRAWVVLVMLRDEYACGAAVVAQSLRAVGTKYPIWCAYADISSEVRDVLGRHFDHMVEVPVIEHPCNPLKTAKQQRIYGSWIEKSFTKWNIMNPGLFPLDKVVLLDADVNVIAPIDDIFDLSAPAATFSSPWVGPYVAASSRPRFDALTVACNRGNPYCDIVDGRAVELVHGATVESRRIESGLRDAIGPIANMVLVAPSEKSYRVMMDRLRESPKFGSTTCQSGHDEQLLARVWLDMGDPVTNIHQEYNWCVGKPQWLRPGQTPKTHQFYNGKPWRDITCEADRKLIKYDDVIAWWKVADNLMEARPEWRDWFYRGWRPHDDHTHPCSMLHSDDTAKISPETTRGDSDVSARTPTSGRGRSDRGGRRNHAGSTPGGGKKYKSTPTYRK